MKPRDILERCESRFMGRIINGPRSIVRSRADRAPRGPGAPRGPPFADVRMRTQEVPLKERTIYLVDGTYNIFRAYHATPRLTNSKGLPTNAVYTFAQILRKLIVDEKPGFLGVAFDTQ